MGADNGKGSNAANVLSANTSVAMIDIEAIKERNVERIKLSNDIDALIAEVERLQSLFCPNCSRPIDPATWHSPFPQSEDIRNCCFVYPRTSVAP